jgi:hypothetical protein
LSEYQLLQTKGATFATMEATHTVEAGATAGMADVDTAMVTAVRGETVGSDYVYVGFDDGTLNPLAA